MEEPRTEAAEEQLRATEAAAAGEEAGQERQKKGMKLMVAIDESEGSLYALSWALDHLFPGPPDTEEAGELVLLHVQQPFQSFVFPAGPAAVYATSAVIESVRKAQQQNSEALLAKAAHICLEKHKPVKVQTLIMEGDPKDMICQAVEQIHPDMLVVGSRGLGKIKRAFLGSVSDYCAHHAKCPVLLVKPPHK